MTFDGVTPRCACVPLSTHDYLGLQHLQLLLQVASGLLFLLLLLQQGVLIHLQLADLTAQVQLLTRLLLPQLLRTADGPDKRGAGETNRLHPLLLVRKTY